VSNTGSGGAEDNVYSLLRPPYLRKNAPFDSVEELRMIRGLGSDDLWASVVDPDPGNPGGARSTVWARAWST